MSAPYAAAVRVVPAVANDAAEPASGEHPGPIVVEVIIRLQHDPPASVPSAPVDLPPLRADDVAEHLTKREQDVLHLLALGLRNGEIAERLVITENTVKQYVKHIRAKLGVDSRLAMAQLPHAQRLLGSPPKA
jgi:DNA-binding NarL/FixJ family response regulator